MAFLGSVLRARRGDFHLLILAALIALLVAPGVSHAAIAPQSAEAVLLWLQSDAVTSATGPVVKTNALLSLANQKAESAPQHEVETALSTATNHCGQHLASLAPENTTRHQIAPATPALERHAAAHLSGVRTNRRLN